MSAARVARSIELPAESRVLLEQAALREYPREACGILIGVQSGDVARVREILVAHNLETERARERFELDPLDYIAGDARARAAGLEIVGIWHSHPDRAAKPSALDGAKAWSSWSYVIVSVDARRLSELRSWRWIDGRFEEETVVNAPASGERLWAQAPRLRLLFAHLAGNALRQRIEVEDFVQETFLRALAPQSELPPREDGEHSLYRFLVHLARHVVIDAARALRARKRSGRVERLTRSEWSSVGLAESQLAAHTAGPSTRLAEVESEARLERAFISLSPEHRRVIGLRQLEGLTAADAAKRMGRSETAVHSLYRRALEAWAAAAR